jgi:hypothetical protein
LCADPAAVRPGRAAFPEEGRFAGLAPGFFFGGPLDVGLIYRSDPGG